MLTDTHCHLDYGRFDEDRDAVVARAREAGVGRILNPGLDLATSLRALRLAEEHDLVYAAVGVHPNDAGGWDDRAYEELDALVGHQKIVAVGEIGLDYYWNKFPMNLQKAVFRRQLELAGEAGLPVVVHNRESDDDIVDMLLGWQAELGRAGSILADRPGVMHSFSAGLEHARRVMEANFYVGITGPVTFTNASDLRELVAALPLERLLIETDAPFLSPHPYRGQRNEPARVSLVAEAIAQVKGLELGEVVRQTGENARQLFGWGK